MNIVIEKYSNYCYDCSKLLVGIQKIINSKLTKNSGFLKKLFKKYNNGVSINDHVKKYNITKLEKINHEKYGEFGFYFSHSELFIIYDSGKAVGWLLRVQKANDDKFPRSMDFILAKKPYKKYLIQNTW